MEQVYFFFLPSNKKLAREKLPNSILGLTMSRLLKWCELSSTTSGDLETLTGEAQIPHSSRVLVKEREQPGVQQTV